MKKNIEGNTQKMGIEKQSDFAFLMLKQWREQIELLTDEQKGLLLSAIYDFQCFGNDFITDDGMLKMLWATIKQTFEFNNRKYEERCQKNSENAKKRWSKKDAIGCKRIETDAKDTDNDIDIEIEKENDIDIETDNISSFEQLWQLYPRKQGKKAAYEAYCIAKKEGASDEQIKEGILHYIEYLKNNDIDSQYIKQGANWFAQKCWQDDYKTAPKEQASFNLSKASDFCY